MTSGRRSEAERPGRPAGAVRAPSAFRLGALIACTALAVSLFVSLGAWQVRRLHWKRELIARVDHRIHATPVPAPGPDRWASVTAEGDEYRHVRIAGTYLYRLGALVQATTGLGSGYWVVTPLRAADGSTVLVNRGFVPLEAANRTREAMRAAGDSAPVVVTGLLRLTEPRGAFLRHNDPAADRWYSRDVQAIAASRGLTRVAPYFVDADAGAAGTRDGPINSPVEPVGGLTVVSFPNNHLSYALTWYALALMAAAAGGWVVREEHRTRRAFGR